MKPGGVVSLKRINTFGFLGKNRLYILMCFAFIVGVTIGSVSFCGGAGASVFSNKLFEYYINDRQGLSFFSVFFSSLFKSFIVYLAFFAFGASVTGVLFSPLLCCCLGIYFGCISAYVYSTFSLKGVAFNAIVLIPVALAFCLCAFFAAKEAFGFSAILLKLLLPKSRVSNLSAEFKCYCGKYLIFIVMIVAVSIIDAAVSTSFMKYFEF